MTSDARIPTLLSIHGPALARHFLVLLAFFVGTAALPTLLGGQTYGSWDVACPLSLPPRFSAPHLHGVIFQGKEFLTDWRSTDWTTPRPSLNWYQPTPDPNPKSTDGKSRWHYAEVQTHCWVERNPYWTRHHADPVGYKGALRPVRTACSGEHGPTPFTEVAEATYDPYDPLLSTAEDIDGIEEEDCPEDGEGQSGEGGETGDCHVEYIVVEISLDGGVTWETYWEGFATICG